MGVPQQQLQSLYVGIPDIPIPILAEVHLLNMARYEIQIYCQDPSNGVFVIDDSRVTNKIVYEVKEAGPSYSSLLNYGMNQRLLEENKVTEEDMRKAFSRLDENMGLKKRFVWAEFWKFLDDNPKKETTNNNLPKGKIIALYRGVKVSGTNIDVSGIEPVYLNIPEQTGTITEKWRDALDAREDTYHYSRTLGYYRKQRTGALLWVFGLRDRPALSSIRDPMLPGCDGGIFVGSRMSADEIIKNLQPIS